MSRNALTSLGRFVRPIRVERNMSLGEMARRMGKSSAALSLYEVRDENFPLEWIDLISEALTLTVDQTMQLRSIHDQVVARRHLTGASLNHDQFLDLYLSERPMLSEEDLRDLHRVLQEKRRKRLADAANAHAV